MIKTDMQRATGYSKIPNGNKRLVFISGPYKGKTEEEKRDNIWHAMRVAIRLWEKNWFVLTPHLNTANFEFYTNLDESVWLEGGLRMLECCQAIFMLRGWESSAGSLMEYERAQKLDKDIYYEDTS